MKTIQVREVPDDTYEVIRRRAQAEGQSLQAYMRDRMIAMAHRPTKKEAVDAIDHALAEYDPAGIDVATIVEDLRADRR